MKPHLTGSFPALRFDSCPAFRAEQCYKTMTHARDAISKQSYKKVGRKVGDLRGAAKTCGRVVGMEEDLHVKHAEVRRKLIDEGRATERMVQTDQLAYIEGQRGELRVLVPGGRMTMEWIDRWGALSEEFLVYLMQFYLGWQRVSYKG